MEAGLVCDFGPLFRILVFDPDLTARLIDNRSFAAICVNITHYAAQD
jgi:hypothetical protein